MTEAPKSAEKMPRAIWALGFVSLLMDISSETVHGLLPVFLVSVLGASYSVVGFIDGIGEATALVLKVFSGPLSDRLGKRKPFVFLGYFMGALSKPLFALAGSPSLILGARIFDRAGKGIRGAPRDALIADIAPPSIRGKAFGLRQSLDTVGAFTGPFLAIVLMYWLHGNYRGVFWIATIPGVLAVLVLAFAVDEPERGAAKPSRKISWALVKEFKITFWMVVFAGAFFQLAGFSEAFLILRAQNLGLSLALAPAVLIAMNIVYSLSAYPIGKISDRMPREWLLIFGALSLASADLFLAMGQDLLHIFVGVVLWGLYLGFTQGVLATLVADASPEYCRGTAYGLFNLLSASALLLASVVAGVLWDHQGPQWTFLVSAILSMTGAVVLLLARRFWVPQPV
jgi:MFS family permease